MSTHTLHLGDCLDVLRTLPDDSVHSIVTDPPYGLSFMGRKWDYDVPSVAIWEQCYRVLKPGGHLLAFAGTRTQHRMAVNIEDAGFEIRDMIAWVYGSGFPKSLDVSKAIDKAAGFQRDRIPGGQGGANNILGTRKCGEAISGEAISGEAQQWAGWGTALKPALEPVTVARKPLDGTVAANVMAHGTGGLNVDECRVGTEDLSAQWDRSWNQDGSFGNGKRASQGKQAPPGRWPANLIHDGSDEVVELFPQTGASTQRTGKRTGKRTGCLGAFIGQQSVTMGHDDAGGSAARFFYTPKAPSSERQGVTHPTVKPLDLMAYLVRLVTPPGGTVLDPFMGSGTTIKAALAEGFHAIGIEREPEYFAMAEHRLNGAQIGLPLAV